MFLKAQNFLALVFPKTLRKIEARQNFRFLKKGKPADFETETKPSTSKMGQNSWF